MSLIYRSLQQATADASTGMAIRPAMQQRRALGNALTRRALFLLLLLSVFCMAGCGLVFWAQKELQRLHPITEPTRLAQAPEAVAIEPWEDGPGPVVTVEPEAEPVYRDVPVEAPAAQPAPPPVPDAGQQPSRELEEIFQHRARRNRLVMDLDRQLASAWKRDDLQAMAPLLLRLSDEAGRDSALYRKWAGTVALKCGDHAAAEAMFENLIRDRRADTTVRVNLVLALLGQKKHDAARQAWMRLQQDFPQDQKIRDLGKLIPEEVNRQPERNASTHS